MSSSSLHTSSSHPSLHSNVDPYVRIFRRLTTSLEPSIADDKATAKPRKLAADEFIGGKWAPSRACLLKTVHQRATKKPMWGSGKEEILLPEQART